jgi:hypothetical protein
MIARIAGIVMLSVIVFVTVSLLVSLGVYWWSGGLLPGAIIGVICGLAVSFMIGAVSIAVRGSAEQSSQRRGNENERSGGAPRRRP